MYVHILTSFLVDQVPSNSTILWLNLFSYTGLAQARVTYSSWLFVGILQNTYLFFCLSLLNIVSSHFDTRSENSSGEICHIDTQEVRNFLSSYRKEKKAKKLFTFSSIFGKGMVVQNISSKSFHRIK